MCGVTNGIAVPVAPHPTRKGEELAAALHPGIMRRQFRVEGGVEIRCRFKDGAVEVKYRVGDFLQRPHPALPHFLGLPERFEDFVRIVPVLLEAPDLHHRGPALGLGGMGGQHRLNLQFVQAALDLFRGARRLAGAAERGCAATSPGAGVFCRWRIRARSSHRLTSWKNRLSAWAIW